MGYVYQNDFRNRLHNKRSEPYGFGKDLNTGEFTNASTADKLEINYSNNPPYALLTEAIYEQNSQNFHHISYGSSIDQLEVLSPSNYRVDVDASIIWFDQGSFIPSQTDKFYAFYEGEGSIIWVEDVTSLQNVVKRIDEHVVYKDGNSMNIVMEGDLNMGTFSIINVSSISNVGTVDGVKISTHKHTGGNNDAPQIDVTGLAENAVQTSKILDDAVTTDKIKDFDVLTANLGTYAVTTSKIANGNVTNDKIANLTIENGKILNGTLTYDKFNVNNVLTGIFNVLYPVGSIYITTTNSCPIASYVGNWEKVSEGRVLQGADSSHSAGTTIAAGLPNITGTLPNGNEHNNYSPTGAFYKLSTKNSTAWEGTAYPNSIGFNANNGVAQNAKGIYRDDCYTVQPPAYVVNIFRRTA